ncbi:MAG: hypothetical protein NTY01_10315 [Verrucomicrobia bacterium]|nr:hypothetical protein [Verrucomicrobiota bacterium]
MIEFRKRRPAAYQEATSSAIEVLQVHRLVVSSEEQRWRTDLVKKISAPNVLDMKIFLPPVSLKVLVGKNIWGQENVFRNLLAIHLFARVPIPVSINRPTLAFFPLRMFATPSGQVLLVSGEGVESEFLATGLAATDAAPFDTCWRHPTFLTSPADFETLSRDFRLG